MSTIERYPLGMTFFSTPERIEIGGVPFIASHEKPTRRDGLIYYRRVAEHYGLDVRPSEDVVDVAREGDGGFRVEVRRPTTRRPTGRAASSSPPGTTTIPNYLGIPGEDLPHVVHYFTEGHPYWRRRVRGDRGGEQQRGRGARVLACGRHRDAGALRRGLRPDGQGLGAAGHHQPGEGGQHRRPLALPGPGHHADRGRDRQRTDRRRRVPAGRRRPRHDRLPCRHRHAPAARACRWTPRAGFRRTTRPRWPRRCRASTWRG